MRKFITLSPSTSSASSHKNGSRNQKNKKSKRGVSPSEYVMRNIFNYSRALVVFSIPGSTPISMLMN